MKLRLDLDDNLAASLKLCAEKIRTTVPDLIGKAIHDAFPYDPLRRRTALSQIVGIWVPRRTRDSFPLPKRFWPREKTPAPLKSPHDVMVDTGILSEILLGRDRLLVNHWLDAVEHGTAFVCSALSVAEIWRTAEYFQIQKLSKLCTAMFVLPVDSEVARMAGEITHRSETGKLTTTSDALFAATAVINRCQIWTRDPRRFPAEIVSFYDPSLQGSALNVCGS
jgi:predicted nucleic acid-binding protein